MDPQQIVNSPYLRSGSRTRGMMLGMLFFLTLTAAHYSFRYDHAFFLRYGAYLAIGWSIELLYRLLKDGQLRLPRASTAVTTALLVLSVPSHMPWIQTGIGILVAVLFGKLMVDKNALRLNPMLLGRLFMMIVFANSIQEWVNPDVEIDALTAATPLGLYASEGAQWPALDIFLGNLNGTWEGFVAVIPGSPGEVMPLLSIIAGILLFFFGVLDWRPGTAYLAGFAFTCFFLDMPVLFHLLAGSSIFTAVYIVTDMRSMPGSKFGRLAGGLIAGILNAFIRDYGYYPEGVVLAVLAVNLLSPTLDRVAFHGRSWVLKHNIQRAQHRQTT